MNKRVVRYRDFVLLALFTAIIFVLGMTPLGMITLGLIKATSVHIPRWFLGRNMALFWAACSGW